MEGGEGSSKSKLYQEIRDKVVDSVVKAVIWAIAAVVLWALYTSYSLDSKMDKKDAEIKGEMLDGFNESVQRDADLQRQINDLRAGRAHLQAPPSLPNLPPPPPIGPIGSGAPEPLPNTQQQPLDYIQQHSKRYSPPSK